MGNSKCKCLFPVSNTGGVTVYMPLRSQKYIPVTNNTDTPQYVGTHCIKPHGTAHLPAEVAAALAGLPGISVGEEPIDWEKVRTLQLIRHYAVGDCIWVVSAAYAFHKAHPHTEIYIEASPDNTEWLAWVPFVRTGLSAEADYIVNFDNIFAANNWCLGAKSPRLEDIVIKMGLCLGVVVEDVSFPISIEGGLERWPSLSPRGYVVFAPFARKDSGRSLPRDTIQHIWQTDFGLPFVLTGKERLDLGEPGHSNSLNLSGRTSLADIWRLVANAAAVVTVDSGPAWIAAVLRRPALVFYTVIKPEARLMATTSCWAVTPEVACYGCGLGQPKQECIVPGNTDPSCALYYTPKVAEYKIMEFLWLLHETGKTGVFK